MPSVEELEKAMMGGITFKGTKNEANASNSGKVKTKAKKKAYISRAHGSGASKMKADIRKKIANRHK